MIYPKSLHFGIDHFLKRDFADFIPRGTGATLVMPVVCIEAANQHLAKISQCGKVEAIARPLRAGAGWHGSRLYVVRDNIELMPRPPTAPELNSLDSLVALRAIQAPLTRFAQDNSEYPRGNWLGRCVWDSSAAILDACCNAWSAAGQIRAHRLNWNQR